MLLTHSGLPGYIKVNLFSAFRTFNYAYLLNSFTQKKKAGYFIDTFRWRWSLGGNTKGFFFVLFFLETDETVTLILCMLYKNVSRQQICDEFSYFHNQNGIWHST